MMTKLPVGLRMLLHEWDETRVQGLGLMVAQRRRLCLLNYQDDLTLVSVCGFLAELLEPLIIGSITVDLRVQMME